VVQQGRGHAWLASLLKPRNFAGDLHVHIFSTFNYA